MNAKDLAFDISDDVLRLGLRGVYLVMDGLTNKEQDAKLEALKSETVTAALGDLTEAKIKGDPILKGFRDLHQAVNRSNRKNVASPENLLYLLLKHRQLPRVNVLVDVYNLISIRTRLALGAHDVAKLDGHVHLRMTNGSERFWPIGSPAPKPMTAGEYSYLDDANDVICRLEVRQVEKTKITETTSEAFYIIQGNAATDDEYLREAADMLVSITKQLCGGRARVLYAPWSWREE